MEIGRRDLIAGVAASAFSAELQPGGSKTVQMFGLIGRMTAISGRRDGLVQLLLASAKGMPGCLSYVIALAQDSEDDIWVTEVWESRASHDASLSLPAVKDAIEKARSMIAAMSTPIITTPLGGQGLAVTQ